MKRGPFSIGVAAAILLLFTTSAVAIPGWSTVSQPTTQDSVRTRELAALVAADQHDRTRSLESVSEIEAMLQRDSTRCVRVRALMKEHWARSSVDSTGLWRLYGIDTTRVTDDERRRHFVGTLQEQREKATAMNRKPEPRN